MRSTGSGLGVEWGKGGGGGGLGAVMVGKTQHAYREGSVKKAG